MDQGNTRRIRRRARQGKLPKALDRLPHATAVQFISECLDSCDKRPTAAALLQHPFLVANEEVDDAEIILGTNVQSYHLKVLDFE
jgi:hypothetical protein